MKQYCSVSGKVCLTKSEAGSIINNNHNRRWKWAHQGKTVPSRKYYCRDCGSWYVTHLKKKTAH